MKVNTILNEVERWAIQKENPITQTTQNCNKMGQLTHWGRMTQICVF